MSEQNFQQQILKSFIEWMALAPSAHNSQPFQVASNGADFVVKINHRGLLPKADPSGKELHVGLGCLIAVWEICLHSLNQKIIQFRWQQDGATRADQVVARFQVAAIEIGKAVGVGQQESQKLKDRLENRFSYRAGFGQNEIDLFVAARDSLAIKSANSHLIRDEEVFDWVSSHYDRINCTSLMSPGYIEELYRWMRFSQSHPRWAFDGLNEEAIGLKPMEAIGASLLLNPKVFRRLVKWGFFSKIFSERSKIFQSVGLWVITIGEGANWIEKGKMFLTEWLVLQDWNLVGAPLSILLDDPAIQEELKNKLKIPKGREIVNILRVGPAPTGYIRYKPARKPSSECVP